jgi:hypothetical protein
LTCRPDDIPIIIILRHIYLFNKCERIKKITESLGEYLPSAKLYLDDVKQVVEIIRQVAYFGESDQAFR